MCGRYSVDLSHKELENLYSALFEDEAKFPRLNVPPTSVMPVILNEDPKLIQLVKWGITPVWMQKLGKTSVLNNVRSETIQEKPTFKKDFQIRRCIIPASSFFEWETNDGKKLPYLIKFQDGTPMTFAGIWSEQKDAEGNIIKTYAIITTQANELVGKIHDRMPVILGPQEQIEWLSDETSIDVLSKIMSPYPAKEMTMHRVSEKINNPRNNNIELLNSL